MAKLVIIPAGHSLPLAKEFFPGWDLVAPGQILTGRRYERIVSLWRPSTGEGVDWLETYIVTRLPPGNRGVEYLV